jgi:hypothetical protein
MVERQMGGAVAAPAAMQAAGIDGIAGGERRAGTRTSAPVDVSDNLVGVYDGTEGQAAAASCCSPAEQASCCEPSQKSSCCGAAASDGCGCR